MTTDNRLIKQTIQVQLVLDLMEGAIEKGVDPYVILKKANVPPDILENRQTRISINFYYSILSAIRDHLQDEALGFFDHKIPPNAFPVFCEAAVGCPDFKSLFKFANDFYGLLTEEFSWEIKTTPDKKLTSISLKLKKDPARYKKFIIEFLMVIPYRVGGWLIGEIFRVKSVHFTFPKPEIIEKYQYLFGGRCFFDADENKFVFNSDILSQPVIRNRSDVFRFLKSTVSWLLLNPDMSPYTRKVRQILMEKSFSNGFPKFEELSRELNISHQHLWRKLHGEGTSYQQIKNQLRIDLAIHLLSDTQLNMNDIAYKIGYTDERPFYKMFMQWTGVAPGQYRRMIRNWYDKNDSSEIP